MRAETCRNGRCASRIRSASRGAQLNDTLPKSVDLVTDGGTPAIFVGGDKSGARLPAYNDASPVYPSYGYTDGVGARMR